jgi:NlpC/P60 family protein
MIHKVQSGLLALALASLLSPQARAGSARRTEPDVRPSQHAAQNTLRAEEGEALVDIAVGAAADLDDQPDCSHFVHLVYSDAGLAYKYESSRDLYRGGAVEFTRVKKPQAGDLIVWPGHVGIVVSRKEKTFFSSVNSGIITESWTAAHWIARGRPRFYRYRVTEETDLSLLQTSTTETQRHGETQSLTADSRR